MTLTLVGSDQVATGNFNLSISKMEMTAYDSSTQTSTKYKPSNTTYNCTVNVETTVTTLGYASFSWPKALDFTNSGLTAFIAKDCNGSSLKLVPVTKVPANTGLILKGAAGSENTYQLETTTEDTDEVSGNLLSATAAEAYTVASSDIYVLSNLDDGQPGFYKAGDGIHVAQYKSYLQYSASGARLGFSFDEQTSGLTTISLEENGLLYNLQGRRVNKPTKGVYVRDGKKIVIK